MSNITQIKPPFILGYWKPWKEDSQFTDSYLDYLKDVGISKYTADTVGRYVQQASSTQVKAINELGNRVHGMSTELRSQLSFLNRNAEMGIELQRISLMLLEDIGKVLRVPDSEKQRQHHIEMGLKFMSNAQKDEDLFSDALNELLEAEKLMKQDYFVLHRIGMIYLHFPKHIDLPKALDYFKRAGKYASVESDADAIRLVNVFIKKDAKVEDITMLAGESYSKAAFTSYVIGDFKESVSLGEKALKYIPTSENKFMLVKYLIRNGEVDKGVKLLDESIDEHPQLVAACFGDLDVINESKVCDLIRLKDEDINRKINELILDMKKNSFYNVSDWIKELNGLLNSDYYSKRLGIEEKIKNWEESNKTFQKLKPTIDDIVKIIKKNDFLFPLSDKEVENYILKYEELISNYLKSESEKSYKDLYGEILKKTSPFGKKTFGGIIFKVDESGEHGLVCMEEDFEYKPIFGNKKNEFTLKEAMKLKKIVYNGYNDWRLPTVDELKYMNIKLHQKGMGCFATETSYWSSEFRGTSILDYSCNCYYFGATHVTNEGFLEDMVDKCYRIRAVRAFSLNGAWVRLTI